MRRTCLGRESSGIACCHKVAPAPREARRGPPGPAAIDPPAAEQPAAALPRRTCASEFYEKPITTALPQADALGRLQPLRTASQPGQCLRKGWALVPALPTAGVIGKDTCPGTTAGCSAAADRRNHM
jgi:hypothetical protein